MHFSIVSFGVVAALMMTSSVYALGISGDATDTGKDVAGGVSGKGKDGVSGLTGDLGGGAARNLTSADIEDIIDALQDILGASALGNAVPAGALKGASPASNDVKDATTAGTLKNEANTASSLDNKDALDQVTRRSFLARRNLGHALHKRASKSSDGENANDEDDENEDDENEDDEEEDDENTDKDKKKSGTDDRDSITRRRAPI